MLCVYTNYFDFYNPLTLNILLEPAHWPRRLSVCKWSWRPGFNPRSSHTKDFKNAT